jgi:hypothetical protein
MTKATEQYVWPTVKLKEIREGFVITLTFKRRPRRAGKPRKPPKQGDIKRLNKYLKRFIPTST